MADTRHVPCLHCCVDAGEPCVNLITGKPLSYHHHLRVLASVMKPGNAGAMKVLAKILGDQERREAAAVARAREAYLLNGRDPDEQD